MYHHIVFWKDIRQSFHACVIEHNVSLQVGKAAKLDKFEVPAKIKLVAEPWTPESGLVTAALKIKREQLKAKFKDDLEKLYQ